MTNTSGKQTRVLIIAAVALLVVLMGGLTWVFVSSPTATTATAAQSLTPLEYQELFADGSAHMLIDVRTPEEFDSGHIQDAVNIPVESLPGHLDVVAMDIPVVVYCRSGNRSATAAQILVEGGFQPVYDLGGINDWVAQGFPIQ